MKEIFYNYRDEEKKPVFTICLLMLGAEVVARGTAICSDKETPCNRLEAQQRNGPGLAKKKAYKSLQAKKNLFEITRREPFSVLNRVANATDGGLLTDFYKWKGFYQPYLSLREKKIVSAVLNKKEKWL